MIPCVSSGAAVNTEIPAERLRVAGITPFTTIDFPGRLSAVAFLQGCPWKCVYCQNPWMQPREFAEGLEHGSWEDLVRLLERRRGLLDGVVFSGGEPCADPALPAALKAVREMGFQTGLHTGGAYPRRLEEVIGLLDWVGFDVKAPPEDEAAWRRVTGVPGAAAHWLESFSILRTSGVAYECRTTAHPDYLSEEDLLRTARWLAAPGVEDFALQICRRPPGVLFAPLPAVGSDYPARNVREELGRLFKRFTERRNDR